MIFKNKYISYASYNYLKDYLKNRNNTNFDSITSRDSNNDMYSIIEQFFNYKTINKDEKEISIRELKIELTDKIEKCCTIYKNNTIDRIVALDTNDWRKDVIIAHEIGHVYMNQNEKNKDKNLNKETLSVFLELLVADSYGKAYYLNLIKEKFIYAKSLLIGDYRWYKKTQKLIYINGLVQADILFNKYREKPNFVKYVLNDVVNSKIDIDMAIDIIKKDSSLPMDYSLLLINN